MNFAKNLIFAIMSSNAHLKDISDGFHLSIGLGKSRVHHWWATSLWREIYWRWFSDSSLHKCLLDGNFLIESSDWVFSLELLKFDWSILVEEFVDGKVSTTNSDINSIHVYLNGNSLGSKLINTFALSHEKDLQLLSLREVVDIFSQFLVNRILSNRDINCNLWLQINNSLFKIRNLHFCIFQLFKKFEWSLVCSINLLLKLEDVICTRINFTLKLDSSFVSLALSVQWFGMLRFDISFSLEQKFLTQNSTLQIIVSVLCVLKVKHMLVQLSSKFTLSHFVSIN